MRAIAAIKAQDADAADHWVNEARKLHEAVKARLWETIGAFPRVKVISVRAGVNCNLQTDKPSKL